MERGTLFMGYHVVLRTTAVIVAIMLLFDSGILSPVTAQLSDNVVQYTANVVGVGASVTPSELNTWTAALTEKEQELERRERELAIGLNAGNDDDGNSQVSTYILSALLFILLILIVLNYSLDLARERYIRGLAKELAHE